MTYARQWYEKALGYSPRTARPFRIEGPTLTRIRGNGRSTQYEFRDGSRFVLYHRDRATRAHAMAQGSTGGYLFSHATFTY